jgi:predicted glycosyltransferase
MYFNAFDASVQAGGYNSYHEVRKFGLPTVFYPNMSTGMDDQLARCQQAETEGWGYVVKERTKSNITKAMTHLIHQPRFEVNAEESGASILQTNLSMWVKT